MLRLSVPLGNVLTNKTLERILRAYSTRPRIFAKTYDTNTCIQKVAMLPGVLLVVAFLSGCHAPVMIPDEPEPEIKFEPYNPPPIRRNAETRSAPSTEKRVPSVAPAPAPKNTAPSSSTGRKTSGRGPVDTTMRDSVEAPDEEDDPLEVRLYD